VGYLADRVLILEKGEEFLTVSVDGIIKQTFGNMKNISFLISDKESAVQAEENFKNITKKDNIISDPSYFLIFSRISFSSAHLIFEIFVHFNTPIGNSQVRFSCRLCQTFLGSVVITMSSALYICTLFMAAGRWSSLGGLSFCVPLLRPRT